MEKERQVNNNRDFNTLFLIMGRTTRQKTNKEIEDLNSPKNQLDLFGIYETLHPIIEYTFFIHECQFDI